jgi:excisionase family DNA binding protein
MTDNKEPKAYSTREAAKLLDVSLRTVQLWVESGVLEAWKTVGGHRRVSPESVQKLLASRKQSRTGERGVLTVLVAEDDPVLLNLYQHKIAAWQPPVRLLTASGGYEAMISIGEQKPDVLIADLMMPYVDGFRMLRTLEQHPGATKTAVIVVTALSDEDIEKRGGIPTHIEVLRKPVNFDELETKVRALAGRNHEIRA